MFRRGPLSAVLRASCGPVWRRALLPTAVGRLLRGLDSARHCVRALIRWRSAVSCGWPRNPAPDHSTISRIRRLVDSRLIEPCYCPEQLVAAGLIKGKTIAVDATTLKPTPRCGASFAGHRRGVRGVLTRLAEAAASKPRAAPPSCASRGSVAEAKTSSDWSARPTPRRSRANERRRTHLRTKPSTPSSETAPSWRSPCRRGTRTPTQSSRP